MRLIYDKSGSGGRSRLTLKLLSIYAVRLINRIKMAAASARVALSFGA